MRIVPCIDIYNGKVVRLTKGNFDSVKTYKDNPVEQALIFRDAGFEYLHIVDLEAARTGQFTQMNVIKNCIRQTNMETDVGGGIRNRDDIQCMLDAGVSAVNIGTTAVLNPESVFAWGEQFGYDKIIPSFDCKNNNLCVSGWEQDIKCSLNTNIDIYLKRGFKKISVTDVTRDGTLAGLNLQFFKDIIQKHPDIELVAGGGVSSLQELEKLSDAQVYAVVIGKALYENSFQLNDLKTVSNALQKNNSVS
jgi:phosphoribosylformimino-5-aminoimidazole carboxamide ribotide isomerase